jgi:hypothetical protein
VLGRHDIHKCMSLMLTRDAYIRFVCQVCAVHTRSIRLDIFDSTRCTYCPAFFNEAELGNLQLSNLATWLAAVQPTLEVATSYCQL